MWKRLCSSEKHNSLFSLSLCIHIYIYIYMYIHIYIYIYIYVHVRGNQAARESFAICKSAVVLSCFSVSRLQWPM